MCENRESPKVFPGNLNLGGEQCGLSRSQEWLTGNKSAKPSVCPVHVRWAFFEMSRLQRGLSRAPLLRVNPEYLGKEKGNPCAKENASLFKKFLSRAKCCRGGKLK